MNDENWSARRRVRKGGALGSDADMQMGQAADLSFHGLEHLILLSEVLQVFLIVLSFRLGQLVLPIPEFGL